MEPLHHITSLHAAASPAGLFASVQANQTHILSCADQQLNLILEEAESRYLYWSKERDIVIRAIEDTLSHYSANQCRETIQQMLDYFDELIAEDCEVADILRRHFKRLEKQARSISRQQANHIQQTGLRFFKIATSQIDACIDVTDNLRALGHHYAKSTDKALLPMLTPTQVETPQQLLKALLA